MFASPPDYQQGETVRIMYIHVPAAWMGLAIYSAMALAAVFGFVTRNRLADCFCVAAAPVGAALVAVCLVTGSIWGHTTWGTWWEWDARMTSVLLLFFLYIGYIAIRGAFEDDDRGSNAGYILLMAGAINIPIIKFSVYWWNTLHQQSSVAKPQEHGLHPDILHPLLAMAAAYALYSAFVILLRLRKELILRSDKE